MYIKSSKMIKKNECCQRELAFVTTRNLAFSDQNFSDDLKIVANK